MAGWYVRPALLALPGMSLAQALWLAALQGFSELFPISSLGHSVVVPRLLGWNIDQQSPTFLPFLVVLHLGTAAALLTFFWRDWLQLIAAWLRSVSRGKVDPASPDEHLAWMLVVGSIPAGILGVFLQNALKQLFAAPTIAAAFLIVNGVIMLAGERLRRSQEAAHPEKGTAKDLGALNWRTAALIGLAQSAALIPGISRSGSTITAGLRAGLSHEAAARFSFLLATPIILAAGLLEVPELLTPDGRGMLGISLAGGLLAGVVAYLSVKFLMRYFEFGRLDPFAWYCMAFGAFALVFMSVR